MFRLNLKIAWRNLWKNKIYVSLNIFGLAAGLAGFVIILLYINYETNFDKWDPELKNVYRVGTHLVINDAEKKEEAVKGSFAKVITTNFSEVEAISFGLWAGKGPIRNYDYNGKKFETAFTIAVTTNNFLKTYPLKAVEGSFEEVYKTPKSYAISLSQAKRIFGNESPINKVITMNDGNFNEKMLIKAVWDDVQYPSVFALDLIGGEQFNEADDAEFPFRYFNVLIKFRPGTDVEALTPKINAAFLQEEAKRSVRNSSPNFKLSTTEALAILKKNEGITTHELIIEPISDLNINSYFLKDPKQNTIYVLTALASFLIIISCVNFTNLAIVQATGRAKEVGIKKVLGAFRFNLAKQFLAETAIQCIIAFFFSLVLVELLLPIFNNLLSTQLSLFNSNEFFKMLSQALCIVVLVIIISGIYPAIILSGFMPIKVLKGNFYTNIEVGRVRKWLMVMQFTISGALVICFLVMNAQLNYMKNKDMGMQMDQVVALSVRKFDNRRLNPEQFQHIKNRLLQINGVKMLARATDGLIGEGIWQKDYTYNGVKTQFIARYTDLDYFKLINAKLIAGRDFSKSLYATDTIDNAIVNETVVNTLGLKNGGIGQYLSYDNDGNKQKIKIIGVVKNIQSEGFEKQIKPTIYLAGNFTTIWRSRILLSLEPQNVSNTMRQITALWKEIEPEQTPILKFESEKFANLFVGYERMGKIMLSFSIITLLISFLGLLTLAAFNAKIRIKEIAIRRILGASTQAILGLLNKDLIKLVLMANILADVFAYLYIQNWFTTFAYRINLPIGLFIMVNIVTIVFTLFIVSIQSLSAVKANPVKALKYE
ncbi:ABC transporter permease [Pedobacter sp. Hv1]|uniref:ABC transporter permease n=1 Tax=Pedobacter sp. Hv1 TaxID=1740090 RepID=UPI0006D8C28B|nr:ABC transporter permease [Pedobacter sp. Hv1]KQC01676.1 hypothetical protein AQF98_04700 [Pedobacter sp. Hv1]